MAVAAALGMALAFASLLAAALVALWTRARPVPRSQASPEGLPPGGVCYVTPLFAPCAWLADG